MIRTVRQGLYRLQESKGGNKILTLDDTETFAWVDTNGIGDILITSHKSFPKDQLLAKGNFRIYEVKDEPDLTDLLHLELHVGNGTWQGYLLPLGLPDEINKRHRIIATEETITRTM